MANKVAYISSPMRRAQLEKFLVDYLELEVARGSELKVMPTDKVQNFTSYEVTISALSDTWEHLLQASFKEGLLGTWGWNKIFVEVPLKSE